MSDWQSVFKDSREYRALIVKEVLEGLDMHPVIVNKKISVYGLGNFEIFVAPDQVIPALKVIKEEIRFD